MAFQGEAGRLRFRFSLLGLNANLFMDFSNV